MIIGITSIVIQRYTNSKCTLYNYSNLEYGFKYSKLSIFAGFYLVSGYYRGDLNQIAMPGFSNCLKHGMDSQFGMYILNMLSQCGQINIKFITYVFCGIAI